MSLPMHHKKGVSAMIGYVLLVSFAIIIGGGMYVWMKSYVPTPTPECPEGISLAIVNATLNCSSNDLLLQIKNNGRFDLAGYYIYARETGQDHAATPLIAYLIEGIEAKQFDGAAITRLSYDNTLSTGDSITHLYNLPSHSVLPLAELEIIPARWETVSKNDVSLLNCGSLAKTTYSLSSC